MCVSCLCSILLARLIRTTNLQGLQQRPIRFVIRHTRQAGCKHDNVIDADHVMPILRNTLGYWPEALLR